MGGVGGMGGLLKSGESNTTATDLQRGPSPVHSPSMFNPPIPPIPPTPTFCTLLTVYQ